MAEQVGAIEIGVRIADERAKQQLHQLEGDVKRTAAIIGAQKATMEIDGDLAPLRLKVKNAKDEIRRLEGEVATCKIKADRKQLKKELRAARKDLKQFDGELAVAELKVNADVSEIKRARAEMALAEREAKLNAREQARRDKIAADAQRYRTIGVHEEQLEVAKLQRRYAALANTLSKPRKAFTFAEHMRVKVDQDHALAEMAVLKAKLAAMGAMPPVGIKVRVDSNYEKTAARVFGAMKALSSMTLRLGPFTMSIKQFGVALAVLGPIITDVVGGLTSLVGVVGTGLTGASAVAGAGLAGMVLQFGGMFAAMKPLASEYSALTKLADAYDKAVFEHGKTSKEAKTAQEKLNTALKNADPAVRRSVKAISEVKQSWKALTEESARRNFGTVVESAAKTAQKVMPILARNTNATMDIVGKSVDSMLDRLGSRGGRSAIDQIGRNFNTSLGPALSGLEHFGAALGKIAASASRLLAPAANAFNRWATGLDAATSNTERLDGKIDRLGKHAADLGKFFMSLGRLMATVLSGGADAGDDLMNSMTATMDRWTQFLRSTSGKNSMKEFFDDAKNGTKAFWNALAPLVASFAEWSRIFGPFAVGAMKVVEVLGKITDGFLQVTGSADGFKGVATTIGSIFAVGKIAAFVGKLGEAALLMRQMSAGSAMRFAFGGNIGRSIVAASGTGAGEMRTGIISGATAAAGILRAGMVAGTAAGTAGGAAGRAVGMSAMSSWMGGAAGGSAGKAAGQSAGNIAKTGAAAAGASKSMGLMARAGARLLPTLAGLGAAGGVAATAVTTLGATAVAYGAYKLLTMKSAADKLNDSIGKTRRSTQELGPATQNMSGALQDAGFAMVSYGKSVGQTSEYKKRLNKLEAEGKRGTEEFRLAQDQLNASLENRNTAEQALDQARQNRVKAIGEVLRLQEQQAPAEKAATDATKKRVEAEAKYNAMIKSGMKKDSPFVQQALKNLTEAQQRETDAKRAALAIANQIERSNNVLAAGFLAQGRAIRNLPPLTEAANNALGKLVRTGNKKIATKIAYDVTYSDPKDAAAVARRAQAALSRGVSSKVVTKIVVDADSAYAAIAGFKALQRGIDPKVVTKVLAETEGDQEILVMNALLGKIPKKKVAKVLADAHVADSVIAAVMKALNDVGRKNPKPKITVNDAASAAIRNVSSLLSGLNGKTATTTIITNRKSVGGGGTPDAIDRVKPSTKPAKGWTAGNTSQLALVGEGMSGKGAPELIADRKTGSVSAVHGPTFMKLTPDQYVIPTERGMQRRGAELMARFARDMGIPGYAVGKPATAQWGKGGLGKAGEQPANLEPVKKYWALTKLEDQVNRKLSSDTAAVKEPENLVIGTGTASDPFRPNEAAIKQYEAQQQPVLTGYKRLNNIMSALRTTFDKALSSLRSFIERRESNIQKLERVRLHNKQIMDRDQITPEYKGKNAETKKRNTEQRKKDKERLGKAKFWYKEAGDMRDSEQGKINDANEEDRKLQDDQYDARLRERDYQLAEQSVRQQLSDLSARAKEEVGNANQSPPAISTAQAAADALATNDALASIGTAGYTASTTDQKIAAQQAIIDAARPLLTDNNAENDAAANSAIQGAASSIQSLREGGTGSSSATSAEIERANAAAALDRANAATNAKALATFAGAGDIGAGGMNAYNAAGGSPVININTLHPGDPSVYRAIGNAAATGFGYQNGIGTSRATVG